MKKIITLKEKSKELLGVIAWAFINAMGITVLLFFLLQFVLDALNAKVVLTDIVIPTLDYMPLSLLIFLLAWIGATIYFYRKFKKPINYNNEPN